MKTKATPQLCDDKICTGCAACYNSCPANAITMQHNVEGFYRPIINAALCISCLKCEQACPILTPLERQSQIFESKLYAGWIRNEKIRKESSSGGAFTALATATLSAGGVVYGAAYDKNMVIFHSRVDTLDALNTLRLSNYAQSYIGDVFRQVKKDLQKGHNVLFCGTPCQAAGLRGYLKKEYETLVTCDFICHGVPSPLMLKSYKDWLERRTTEHISKINFRDKRKGWYDAVRIAETSRKSYVLKGNYDNYWIGFNDNKNLQECCYECKFIGIKRNTDITIADFWGIGKQTAFGHKTEIKDGISAIIISTPKGEQLFEKARHLMKIFRRDISEIIEGNTAMVKSSRRPIQRDSFYRDLLDLPYDSMITKYLQPNFKSRVVKFFREYLPASVTTKIREICQK